MTIKIVYDVKKPQLDQNIRSEDFLPLPLHINRQFCNFKTVFSTFDTFFVISIKNWVGKRIIFQFFKILRIGHKFHYGEQQWNMKIVAKSLKLDGFYSFLCQNVSNYIFHRLLGPHIHFHLCSLPKAIYGTTNSGFAPLKVHLKHNGESLEVHFSLKMFLIKFYIDR